MCGIAGMMMNELGTKITIYPQKLLGADNAWLQSAEFKARRISIFGPAGQRATSIAIKTQPRNGIKTIQCEWEVGANHSTFINPDGSMWLRGSGSHLYQFGFAQLLAGSRARPRRRAQHVPQQPQHRRRRHIFGERRSSSGSASRGRNADLGCCRRYRQPQRVNRRCYRGTIEPTVQGRKRGRQQLLMGFMD